MFDEFNSNDISAYIVDMKYNVDIAFVVDATGSMGMENILSIVKQMIPNFYRELVQALERKDKHVDELRVKVICFRDFLEYKNDRCVLLIETDFFVLSDKYNDQSSMLLKGIESIEAIGGGDIPEDGLEALARAMQSDWCKPLPNRRRRHIIVLFTDAPTHELGHGKDCELYPPNMPSDFGELIRMWGNQAYHANSMEYSTKRLILFIPQINKLPENDGWRRIVNGRMNANGDIIEKPWENSRTIQFDPKGGFKTINFQSIFDQIVNSV